MSEQAPQAVVEVTAKDLHGPGVVFCPNPKMTLWSTHPKVYVDLSHEGEGKCPLLWHRVPPEGRREDLRRPLTHSVSPAATSPAPCWPAASASAPRCCRGVNSGAG